MGWELKFRKSIQILTEFNFFPVSSKVLFVCPPAICNDDS